MAIRVRCPHCKAELRADDSQAGRPANCSECGGGFSMPLPDTARKSQRIDVAAKCPSCQAAIAPGSTICKHCLTDTKTGRRLALRARLRYVSFRTWAIAGASVVVLLVVGTLAAEYYRTLTRTSSATVSTVSPSTAANPAAPAADPAAASAAEALLAATSEAQRRAAIDRLARIGSEAAGPLHDRLRARKPAARDSQARRNWIAAIDFLAQHNYSAAIPTLIELQAHAEIRRDCLRARGLLGDASAAPDLKAEWLVAVRRKLFFESVQQLQEQQADAATQAVVRLASTDAERLAQGLRVLIEPETSAVFESLLAALFSSWSWLGQDRDERFASELWAAAQPARDKDLDFKLRIRAARRVLDRASQRGSAEVCAAAGIVLAQSGPQYQSLKREIIKQLAATLLSAPAAERQEAVWALARLTGSQFAHVDESRAPLDVDESAFAAAIAWARANGHLKNDSAPVAGAQYASAPLFTRRVLTPQRQLEAQLLAEMARGWEPARGALDRWLDAKLGFTPRVSGLLNPARRDANPIAIVSAMYLAATLGSDSTRPQLDLWRQALDQPAWLRGAAVTALAALDARFGKKGINWPADLTPDMLREVESPGVIEIWGRLIHAGGPRLIEKLRADRDALPKSVRDRLLRATS